MLLLPFYILFQELEDKLGTRITYPFPSWLFLREAALAFIHCCVLHQDALTNTVLLSINQPSLQWGGDSRCSTLQMGVLQGSKEFIFSCYVQNYLTQKCYSSSKRNEMGPQPEFLKTEVETLRFKCLKPLVSEQKFGLSCLTLWRI